MGWENRRNGSYYYRKERVGSRIISSYVGNGHTAELIGQLSSAFRSEKQLEQQMQTAEIEAMKAEDRALDELLNLAAELMKAELIAEGFHQHDRGEWRKSRNAKDKSKIHTSKE